MSPTLEKLQAPPVSEGTEKEHVDTRQVDSYIEICRQMLNHPLINDRTRREYDQMLNELRAEGVAEKVRQNINYLEDTIKSAESYGSAFKEKLNEAVEKKWINNDSKNKWLDRFHDPNTLEWDRKEWLRNEFPRMCDNWKQVAEDRQKVIDLAGKHGIDTTAVPELGKLLNTDAFLSLHYHSRVDVTATVHALIKAHAKNKVRLITFVRKELRDWADAGYMHTSKIGQWMERVMNSDNPEAFVSDVLYPFKKNWMEVRGNFDALNKELDKQGIPRGFRPVNENDFLLMDYKQRTSYCALAWLQLEDAGKEHETDKLLAARKLAIRHCLNTEDWEEADELLQDAARIRPDDAELRSMREYLHCHRSKVEESKETPQPAMLVREMREVLSSMHSPQAQTLAIKTLTLGPATYNRFAQVYGNFGWCVEVAQMSEKDLQTRSDLQHTAGAPGSMLDAKYEGTESIVADITAHADESAGKTPPNLSANEHWGYWATLIPDVPFALYREDRQKISRLKYLLRSLHSVGGRFSVTGDNTRQAA